MSEPTTSIFFSASAPAPLAGYQDAIPQSDGGTPQQKVSHCVPNTGGAAVKTADYTLTAADCGKLIVANSASAIAFTLPAAIPFGQWQVRIANIGAGALSVVPGGTLALDGATAAVSVAQLQGLSVCTDGANYFSSRGIGATGSNATSIQGKPVSATAPTNGQVLQYDATSGLYVPTTASGGGGGGTPWLNIVNPASLTMAWMNQGSATETVGSASRYLFLPPEADTSTNLRGRQIAASAAPFSVTAGIVPHAADQNFLGVHLYVSDGTKLATIAAGNGNFFGVQHLNSPTSWNSTVINPTINLSITPIFFKIFDDGTDLNFYWSPDGSNFILVYSEARLSWLSSVAFFGYCCETANVTLGVGSLLVSWAEGTS